MNTPTHPTPGNAHLATPTASARSLRQFLRLGAIVPVLAALTLNVLAGSGYIAEVSKRLTTEFISCRVQYFGPATTILGRATVDGRGVGEAITQQVRNGEIVRFRFYGDLRNPKAGVINLRSPETGTVRVHVP
jgi:hypothetical protein